MAKQTINIGTSPNKGDGDPLRTAFTKINENFTELYNKDATDVNLSSITKSIIPDTDVAYDLGSADKRFRDLYLSGSSIDLGGTVISVVDGDLQLGGVKIPTQTDLNNAVSVIPADIGDLTDTQGLLAHNDSTKLVNGDLEVVLNSSGTLTTPLLLPKAFTAVLDTEHFNPQPGIALIGDPWEYQFEFQANPDGTIQLAVNDPVFQSNPGYVVGHAFRFTEADHGIPGYNFDILIMDIGLEAGGYYTQIATGPMPEYPSTIASAGAIKLTADTNSLVFGTDGLLEVPNLKANGVVAGVVGGINDTPLNIETYATDGESTVVNSWLFGTDGSVTFPDSTTQTTAWTGSVPGLTYSEVDGTSEIGVTADIFDFGDGKTIDMQNSSILLNGSTITGSIAVDGPGSLLQTVAEGEASGVGGIAYSYNGVSIGVIANPVGEFNTEQSTIQVSSGEVLLRSTAQQNGDTQYTSTGEVRITPSNFRISLAPNTSWQGELTFDENEFRIPSDNIVGEGATLRLSNLSEISIPLEQGESTFNIGIVSKVNYDAEVVLQSGVNLRVRMLSGTPQADWVFWIPEIFRPGLPILMVTITEVTPVDGVPDDFDLVVDQDLGAGLLLGAAIRIYDMASDRDPRQISINSDGELNGLTSINNVNAITGVSELRGYAVDQWSYISSPTDSGTATNIAFGYFGEGGLQNLIYGATSIENLNIGPLGTGPDAPLIRTLVSEENGLAIDLDISSGTSGDVSGHVTIGTGDVGTKGEIFLNAPVNVEGGTVRIDTAGSILPATRITKEFIEFQGASQLSMPHDFGISKLSIDIAAAEALNLSVTSETVSGGETTWSGVSWEEGIFDFSTAIGWVYTDLNGVNHVITGASDVDEDNQWDVVFATTTDLTTEYGPGGWGGVRIWNPENVDNTRSVQIDYDGVLTGISEIVDLQSINTSYLNYNGSIQIGSAFTGDTIQLAHPKLQIFAVPPTTSKGADGDFLGQVAFDANYIYYCTTAYSGPSEVAATNYFDVTDGNGHYVQADVTTPSILGTGTLSVTNVMVGGVPSTEEVTSYELISGSTYRFFLANTAEPWNTLSTSRLEISPNIWKRVAWSGDTW